MNLKKSGGCENEGKMAAPLSKTSVAACYVCCNPMKAKGFEAYLLRGYLSCVYGFFLWFCSGRQLFLLPLCACLLWSKNAWTMPYQQALERPE
jgi:hypothetical protein